MNNSQIDFQNSGQYSDRGNPIVKTIKNISTKKLKNKSINDLSMEMKEQYDTFAKTEGIELFNNTNMHKVETEIGDIFK